MRIIITGSNGIIGQQLIIDLLISYPDSTLLLINRTKSNLTNDKRVKNILLDILETNESELVNIFKQFKPNIFFHLAWETGHSEYLSTKRNIEWAIKSIKLIEIFYNNGGAKFIGIGSSLEYDWNDTSPFFANKSNLTGNNYLYGTSKVKVAKFLSKLQGISYLWCRIFFVFGPSQEKTRLIPVIINHLYTQKGEFSYNPKLIRDYLSTMEISNQLLMMLNTKYSGELNICSGNNTQLGDLVNLLESIMGKKIKTTKQIFNDKFEKKSIYGNINEILNYYPDYSYNITMLKNDLELTVNNYINHYYKS